MTRRTRSASRRRSPEAQLTGAFNRLVADRPVTAAIVLVVVALGAWLLLRDTGGADAVPSSESTAASSATGTADPSDAGQTDPASGLPYIAESDLPPQAQEVLDVVRAGGPFEFEQDGGHFGNYEGLLPQEPSGYYREYTVQMPGDSDRGAHRFVVGDGGEIYWTTDHYESFSIVKEDA